MVMTTSPASGECADSLATNRTRALASGWCVRTQGLSTLSTSGACMPASQPASQRAWAAADSPCKLQASPGSKVTMRRKHRGTRGVWAPRSPSRTARRTSCAARGSVRAAAFAVRRARSEMSPAIAMTAGSATIAHRHAGPPQARGIMTRHMSAGTPMRVRTLESRGRSKREAAMARNSTRDAPIVRWQGRRPTASLRYSPPATFSRRPRASRRIVACMRETCGSVRAMSPARPIVCVPGLMSWA